MHVELRVRTFIELCLGKSQYFRDAFLKELTGLDGCIGKLFDSSFDTSSNVKGKDKQQRYLEAFEAGILDTIKPSRYSNMWHIFALSNVIGCSITSIYPCVHGSLIDRNYMNISIHPIKNRCSSTAVIMWTNTQRTDLRGWFPNHFVPLMPQDLVANSTSSKTYAQVTAQNSKKKTSSSTTKVAGRETGEKLSKQTSSAGHGHKARTSEKRKETPVTQGNTKKTKYQGSFQYKTSFDPLWTDQWPCIVSCPESKHSFHCKVCKRTVSCAKQGVRDVKIHIETNMHQNNAKGMKNQSTLFQVCASAQNKKDKVCISFSVCSMMLLIFQCL